MHRELSSAIAKALRPILVEMCHDKDNFEFVETHNGRTVEMLCLVGVDDIGGVSGRAGRTALAIKRLVVRAGENEQIKCTFNLRSNGRGQFEHHKFKSDPDFDSKRLIEHLRRIGDAVGLNGRPRLMQSEQEQAIDVVISAANARDRSTVQDMTLLFYPWGYTNGRIIRIKPDNEPLNHEHAENLGHA